MDFSCSKLIQCMLLPVVLLLNACGNSSGVATGGSIASPSGASVSSQSVAFSILNTAPAASCSQGGVTVESGIDVNGNGVLDTSEITNTQYICNGVAGTNGASGINGLTALVSVIVEPPGANCATGGKKVSSGLNTNGNGILDTAEITSSSYICNGATGAVGVNGTNGVNTLLVSIAEPVGTNCPYGGTKVTSGLDTNGNGILDSGEVTSTTYTCNGANGTNGNLGTTGVTGTAGTNGLNTLVAIVAEPAGANCIDGGTKATSGLDTNGNGTLDPLEVTSTTYVCNGTAGSVWRDGSGTPLNSLGADGDYYLNVLSGDVYLRASATYAIVANIMGATGVTGASGTNGTNGIAGSVWRDGSGIPSNSLGADGDYYLNILTDDVYLRASGTYSVVANIKGTTGATGATGANGTNGTNGATGSAGTNAISVFAEFYALMPGNNAATVAAGADVQFPQNGPSSGAGIVPTNSSTFQLSAIGTYQIMFQVSVNEPGQLVLTLNGSELAYTVTGRAIGTSQIVGISLVTTTTVNSILTVRNPAGESTALTITPNAGGADPVSADVVITQLN
jgi:hypothetical protein